jgi:hypothetical protein
MPREPVDEFWRDQIKSIAANLKRMGPGPIRRLLRDDVGPRFGRTDIPSERTVSRILRRFRALPEEEKRPFREFVWPDSMEPGDVPWEASAAVLELLRFLQENEAVQPPRRPLVRSVVWYWRITQAVPSAPVPVRWYWVTHLLTREIPGATFRSEVFEWMIATGNGATGQRTWFGEDMTRTSPWSIEGPVTVQSLSEAAYGHPMTMEEAMARLPDLFHPSVRINVKDKKGEEEKAWESEPTEKEPSSSEGTDAGARPSSSKGSGSTSSRKTARKSRGS